MLTHIPSAHSAAITRFQPGELFSPCGADTVVMVFGPHPDSLPGSPIFAPTAPEITAYGSSAHTPQGAAAVLRAAASRFGLILTQASPDALALSALLAHSYGALTGGPLTAPARHGTAAVAVVSRALQLAAGTSLPAPADPELLEDLLFQYACFNDTGEELVEALRALAHQWSFAPTQLLCRLCVELLTVAPNSAFAALAGALADSFLSQP